MAELSRSRCHLGCGLDSPKKPGIRWESRCLRWLRIRLQELFMLEENNKGTIEGIHLN